MVPTNGYGVRGLRRTEIDFGRIIPGLLTRTKTFMKAQPALPTGNFSDFNTFAGAVPHNASVELLTPRSAVPASQGALLR